MERSSREMPPAKAPRRPPPPWLVAAAAAAPLLAATPARAGAIVDDAGCRQNEVPRGDEASSGPVDLGFEVNFGGTTYAQVYVDTNGAVRFAAAALGFDALRGATWADPPSHGVPFVAPFHDDLSTLAPTSKAVTYGPITYAEGRKAFCVNWIDVEHSGGPGPGTFGSSSSFQLLLVERDEPGAFDVVFNYDRLEREDPNRPAFVGYFDGRNEVELPGSRAGHALLDVNSSGLVYGQRGGDEVGRYVLPVVEVPAPPAVKAQLTGKALGPGGQPLAGAAARACDGQGLCVNGVTSPAGVYRLRGFEGADVADLWKVELAPPRDSNLGPPDAVFFSFDSVDVPVASVVDATFSPPAACVEANLVPAMTGPNAPSGTVTSSGFFSPGFDDWRAFDADIPSMWISTIGETPAWIAYEWPGGPRTVTRYAIHFVNGTLTSRAPSDWTLYGLAGNLWTPIDVRTNQTGWFGTERREFTVASPGAYNGYRLLVNDDNDPSSGIVVVSMGRLEFIGCP